MTADLLEETIRDHQPDAGRRGGAVSRRPRPDQRAAAGRRVQLDARRGRAARAGVPLGTASWPTPTSPSPRAPPSTRRGRRSATSRRGGRGAARPRTPPADPAAEPGPGPVTTEAVGPSPSDRPGRGAGREARGARRSSTCCPRRWASSWLDTSKPNWEDDPDGASYIEHLVARADPAARTRPTSSPPAPRSPTRSRSRSRSGSRPAPSPTRSCRPTTGSTTRA